MTDFVSLHLIEKGWSPDRKYRAETASGEVFLLRVMPGAEYDSWLPWYERQKEYASLGVPMCDTYEFGRWPEGGVYAVQRWIDGEDAEPVLARLTPAEQYREGLEAGRILRAIQSLPVPDGLPDWEAKFNAKIDRKIRGYLDCPLRIEGDGAIFRYLEENRRWLKGRPNTCQHGDYHVGNMMFERDGTSTGRLTIIDFNREDFGDPWEEFNRIVWCAGCSPAFARGRIDGYFGGPVPELFWRLLVLYIASNTLSSIYWAVPFGEREIATMTKQAADVLRWFDGMKNPVPEWYREAAGKNREEKAE